jgi:hypothetical protein
LLIALLLSLVGIVLIVSNPLLGLRAAHEGIARWLA